MPRTLLNLESTNTEQIRLTIPSNTLGLFEIISCNSTEGVRGDIFATTHPELESGIAGVIPVPSMQLFEHWHNIIIQIEGGPVIFPYKKTADPTSIVFAVSGFIGDNRLFVFVEQQSRMNEFEGAVRKIVLK